MARATTGYIGKRNKICAVAAAAVLALLATAPGARATIITTGSVNPSIAGPGNATVSGSIFIGQSGAGTAEVNGGSTVDADDFSIVGSNGNAGSLTVTGAGSQFNVNNGTDGQTRSLFIAPQAGAASNLQVENGGSLTTGSLVFSQDTGSNSTGVVTGAGSSIVTAAVPSLVTLDVARGGTATLDILNGATVNSGAVTNIASQAGGDGTLRVSGAGSQLIVGQSVSVGQFGTGQLQVLDGGVVNGGGTMLVGSQTGSVGELTISGSGSTVTNNSDNFFVGNLATGTVNIGDNPDTAGVEDSGTLSTRRAVIGAGVTANATVNVSGANAAWNVTGTVGTSAAFMSLATRGTAVVNASNGASILIDSITGGPTSGGLILAGSSFNATTTTGNAQLNLDGAGTTLTQRTGLTFIGNRGVGEMNVTNGALADMSLRNVSIVGRFSTATGTVNVTGAGSTWDAGNNLVIGANADLVSGAVTGPGGTGTVNVANGGTLRADTVFLGADATLTGGGGTVFGNVTSEGTVAAGNSPGIMDIHGNLTLTSLGLTEIELGGTNIALSEYDQINLFDNAGTGAVEGNLDIDGTIDVTLFGGYTAALGDFFDVFTALDIDVFGPVWNLPTLGLGLDWDIATVALGGDREALRLSVVSAAQVSAPGGIAVLLIGLAGLGIARRKRAG